WPLAMVLVQFGPRATARVLGNAVGVFAGVPVHGTIDDTGTSTGDVQHAQPDGAPDGGVGTPPRPEETHARVDVQPWDDGAADHDERPAIVTCRVDATDVEHRVD